ncbi:MAG: hypothetical protein M3Q99_16540 [Acidobacteriota bacterium]|nr:hypothetical protein [Acidobacteriota bacterium]
MSIISSLFIISYSSAALLRRNTNGGVRRKNRAIFSFLLKGNGALVTNQFGQRME